MKFNKKLLVVVGLVGSSVMGTNVMAASATSNASATIVTPIAINNTAALDFGSFSHAAAGTVTIDTAGTRGSSGGVTLIGSGGAAATFDVAGTASSAYSITLPASSTITDGTDTMTINTYVSNPDAGTGGTLDGAGAGTIAVGATLVVAGTEGAGAYTGTFDVTVDYQ